MLVVDRDGAGELLDLIEDYVGATRRCASGHATVDDIGTARRALIAHLARHSVLREEATRAPADPA